jgi:hypothetical protein
VANPRAEAQQRIGSEYEARVLEPSPPALGDEPWFADDPVARGQVPAGRRLVSPVSGGDLLWDELAADDPELTGWCAERWLGAYRRLAPAPGSLVETRLALHELAEQKIAKAREAVNGKIGLRYTRAGFGTPFFGKDEQLRVEADELVHVRDGDEQRSALDVDRNAALFLGDWFGFAYSVLEQLRAESADELEPSRVQIWPEHFDAALELGAEASGARAGYGCSPGDELHPEPYLYVAPWSAKPQGALWQAEAFSGAELGYGELLESSNQRETALDFFRNRLAVLIA